MDRLSYFGAPEWTHVGSKIVPKSILERSLGRFEGAWGSLGGQDPKTTRVIWFLAATWNRLAGLLGLPWGRLGDLFASQMKPKWIQSLSKNRSKCWCLLTSIFWKLLVEFRKQNGAKLAPKSNQKLDIPLKAEKTSNR